MVDTYQGRVRQQWLDSLAEDIAWLINKHSVKIVAMSSGALAWGLKRLGRAKEKIGKSYRKQITGAIGQVGISNAWESAFDKWNLVSAQMLLTPKITGNASVGNTIESMLEANIVPFINENIPLLTEYDNDQLAVEISKILHADALIFLTDVEGLFSGDPRNNPNATLIPEVNNITAELKELAVGSSSGTGTGGMQAKINAAELAINSGCHVAIAGGEMFNPLRSISDQAKCTWFIAPKPK